MLLLSRAEMIDAYRQTVHPAFDAWRVGGDGPESPRPVFSDTDLRRMEGDEAYFGSCRTRMQRDIFIAGRVRRGFVDGRPWWEAEGGTPPASAMGLAALRPVRVKVGGVDTVRYDGEPGCLNTYVTAEGVHVGTGFAGGPDKGALCFDQLLAAQELGIQRFGEIGFEGGTHVRERLREAAVIGGVWPFVREVSADADMLARLVSRSRLPAVFAALGLPCPPFSSPFEAEAALSRALMELLDRTRFMDAKLGKTESQEFRAIQTNLAKIAGTYPGETLSLVIASMDDPVKEFPSAFASLCAHAAKAGVLEGVRAKVSDLLASMGLVPAVPASPTLEMFCARVGEEACDEAALRRAASVMEADAARSGDAALAEAVARKAGEIAREGDGRVAAAALAVENGADPLSALHARLRADMGRPVADVREATYARHEAYELDHKPADMAAFMHSKDRERFVSGVNSFEWRLASGAEGMQLRLYPADGGPCVGFMDERAVVAEAPGIDDGVRPSWFKALARESFGPLSPVVRERTRKRPVIAPSLRDDPGFDPDFEPGPASAPRA
jgi:hypothetical protein